jgi:splicing factor 3B subunit 2
LKRETRDTEDSSKVVYVSEQLDVKDAALEAFSDVFARFQLPPDEEIVCTFI